MSKKEISISLDEDILKMIDDLCNNSDYSPKRSTVINKVLKEHFKLSKKERKNG